MAINRDTTTDQLIASSMHQERKVGLFVTCLANTLRPSIGFAAINLLEAAGCEVLVPQAQGCCGQPAFNSGDDAGTRAVAQQLIKAFESVDYVVVPSGSCAGMIKKYVELFADDPVWSDRARGIANKTYELLSFLVDVCDFIPEGVTFEGSYTYHDSCSGLRALNVFEQPRKLLSHVDGLKHIPLNGNNECCGFGGTFCVKYSDISDAIVSEKVENIHATKADYLLGGDYGCLMNMAGKMNRVAGNQVQALHAAEVLAGLVPDSKAEH